MRSSNSTIPCLPAKRIPTNAATVNIPLEGSGTGAAELLPASAVSVRQTAD